MTKVKVLCLFFGLTFGLTGCIPTMLLPPPGTLWKVIEVLVDQIVKSQSLVQNKSQPLEIYANQSEYKVGELLTITCRNIPMNGYINVLNVDRITEEATVLYPNKYHQDNRVAKGTTITIPSEGDPFTLPAREPLGENMIVVFVSRDSLNAYEMYGEISGPFKSLSKLSVEEEFVSKTDRDWKASKIVVHIVK